MKIGGTRETHIPSGISSDIVHACSSCIPQFLMVLSHEVAGGGYMKKSLTATVGDGPGMGGRSKE